MSCADIDRVRRMTGVPSHIKHFLSCVAFYADETHSAEIYIIRLAEDIGVGERQVQKLQQKAVDLGFVTLTPTGHKGRNIYTLHFPEPEVENIEARTEVRETRTLVRDSAPVQPEPGFEIASDIPNQRSGKVEKPELEVGITRTTVRETTNPNCSSPLLESDSDSDSTSKESIGVKEVESESINKSVNVDKVLTPEGVELFDWLTKQGFTDPPCSELVELALDQGADMNTVRLAFIYAKRCEYHGAVQNAHGWLVQAVRKSGWHTVAEYANKKTHPVTSPMPGGDKRPKQSKMARFRAALQT